MFTPTPSCGNAFLGLLLPYFGHVFFCVCFFYDMCMNVVLARSCHSFSTSGSVSLRYFILQRRMIFIIIENPASLHISVVMVVVRLSILIPSFHCTVAAESILVLSSTVAWS